MTAADTPTVTEAPKGLAACGHKSYAKTQWCANADCPNLVSRHRLEVWLNAEVAADYGARQVGAGLTDTEAQVFLAAKMAESVKAGSWQTLSREQGEALLADCTAQAEVLASVELGADRRKLGRRYADQAARTAKALALLGSEPEPVVEAEAVVEADEAPVAYEAPAVEAVAAVPAAKPVRSRGRKK
jgi:hypothetical protein